MSRAARRTTALAAVLVSACSLPLVLASPGSADAVASEPKPSSVGVDRPEDCKNTESCATALPPSTVDGRPMDASGCTWAPYGTVCGAVYGTDKFINNARVTRSEYSLEGICQYQGRFEVFNAKGKLIYGKNTAVQKGCIPGSGYLDFTIKKNFRTGTKTCLSWWQKGEIQGSRVCFKLSNG